MGLEEKIPSIDLETPSREMIPPQYSKCLADPFTSNQQTIDQLIQDLAQSKSENKRYVEIIVDLH